jgi:hypothetical protein
MIANVHFGTSVEKSMRYVQGPGRDHNPDRAQLLGGQGVGFQIKTDEDVKLATQMMKHNGDPAMQASPTKQSTIKALHMSVNWPPSQTPNQQEMLEAMQEFLKAVGMGNAMAVMHRHTDKAHPHGHFVASTIDPKTGLAYDRYQFIYKVKHKEIEWERERNQITPERQFRHDIAKSALELDFSRVRSLLRDGGVVITPRTVEGAISLGGHFGAKLATYREEFFKTIQREPEYVRRLEPERQDRIRQPERRRVRTIQEPIQPRIVENSQKLTEPLSAAPLPGQPVRQIDQRWMDQVEPSTESPALPHLDKEKEQHAKLEREVERLEQRGKLPEPGKLASGPVPEPVDRWWMEPIEPKQTVKIPARWDASGPQHDEPTPMIERLGKVRADSPEPIGPEPTPKRIGIPAQPEPPRPAMTDDELDIEHRTLAAVAFKNGDTITKDELNDLIKTGGRLGPDIDAARERFLKSQGPQLKKSPDGSDQDRWWMEPAEAGPPRKPLMLPGNQDDSKDKQLLRDGKREADSAEDVKRREFIERMERSHKQFGKLTPSMRLALGQEPERPKSVKEIDLDPSKFRRVRDREPDPGFFKHYGDAVRDAWQRRRDQPEPTPKKLEYPAPMGRDMRDDDHDEPRKRIERIREMSGEGSTQRGQAERGDLQDRTDQTAEGRRYLKQQKSRGRGR